MKRILSSLLAAAILLSPLASEAQRGGTGFEGGIRRNERDSEKNKSYKEMLYITGEPVELSGVLETRVAARSIRYKYELENVEKGIVLSRSITLERKLSPSEDNTQVVEVNNITSYKEEIATEDSEYELKEYQFYNSTVDDNQPMVTHYQGSWNGKKVYNVNEDEAELTQTITGNIFGFDQFWGATEKQVVRYELDYEPNETGNTDDEDAGAEGEESEGPWSGTVDTQISINKTVRDTYIPHTNTVSSFDGIYTLSEADETVMKYNYDLPLEGDENGYRNIGSGSINYRTTPTQEQLYIPRYSDIKTHWGEMYIKKLAGLQAASISQKYFLPDQKITREEFAVWLIKSLKLENMETSSTRAQTAEAEPRFEDISRRHPNYDYIQNIRNRKIMNGVGDNKFEPDASLTREEAAVIIARALGIERIAPNHPFATDYGDDRNISIWAKKAVFSVKQVDIMYGYGGNFMPKGTLTRAEATALVERIIDYVRVDLKGEYGI